MTTNASTTPKPTGVLSNGSIAYDPETWLVEAVQWLTDDNSFLLAAALVNATHNEVISSQLANAAFKAYVESSGVNRKLLIGTIRRLRNTVEACNRPLTIGSIWFQAEKNGWLVNADPLLDMDVLVAEMYEDLMADDTLMEAA